MGGDISQLAGDDCFQFGIVENLNQYLHIKPSEPPSARHQLPRDIVDFTGRKEQLEKANTLIGAEIGANRTAPPILAIYGMPGVGKSAFAIHLAHLQENSFPYAQLYADLRERDGRNKDPSNILADFLRVLGIEERFIPDDLDSRASIYRSQLNDKKALILLDNARDISQVRPLLPGSSSCAVIITSRRPLSTLEGTNPFNLGILSEDEALLFLSQLIGNDRIQSEPEEAKRVVALCGQLPLAIRIAGGTMREKPHWTIGYYVNRLADEKERLGRLKLDDLDVRASFNISYRELSPVEARLFRLLNVLDVSDFSCEIATAILNVKNIDAIDEIEVLVKIQLLESIGEGRYRFHDLVRLYSKELLEKKEKPKTRNAARLRVIDWYVKKSAVLGLSFHPDNRRQVPNLLQVESNKSADAERIDLQNALTWFELERRNIISLAESANTLAEYKIVWRLAHYLSPFLGYREYWTDIVHINTKAMEAVNRVGDQFGKSIILNNLGNGYRSIRKWEDAIHCFEQSLAINVKLRDRQNESV
jgi:tetratricopeptide (TPR) repeat protein